MKYLKLFENFDYYTRISISEFDDEIFDKWLDIKGEDEVLAFNEKEIEFIKNFCELNNLKFFIKYRQALSDKVVNKIWGNNYRSKDIVQMKINLHLTSQKDVGPIVVYKKSDEWYYAQIYGKDCYKCDQMEGLRKLIEDTINNTRTMTIWDKIQKLK